MGQKTYGFYTDSALILGSAKEGSADFTVDLDEGLYAKFVKAEADYYDLASKIQTIRKEQKKVAQAG